MSVRTIRACVVAAVLGGLWAGLSALAVAEPAGNIDLNAFRPAMDSRGYLTVNASQVLGDKEISFGLGALDWGHSLLKFEANGNKFAISNIFAATLVAAFGVHAGPIELEFGASLPFVLMNGDISP